MIIWWWNVFTFDSYERVSLMKNRQLHRKWRSTILHNCNQVSSSNNYILCLYVRSPWFINTRPNLKSFTLSKAGLKLITRHANRFCFPPCCARSCMVCRSGLLWLILTKNVVFGMKHVFSFPPQFFMWKFIGPRNLALN